MNADEYIRMTVNKEYWGYAKVIVSHAKSQVHYPLQGDQVLPPDDDEQTIFLRIEETA